MGYIVPRDIPKNCFECPCCTLGYCRVDVKTTEYAKYVFSDGQDGRHPDCPLIELPPHGRLGDLDALYEEISNGNKAYNGIDGYDGEYQHIGNVDDCLDVIKYSEAVIEAEGSEE